MGVLDFELPQDTAKWTLKFCNAEEFKKRRLVRKISQCCFCSLYKLERILKQIQFNVKYGFLSLLNNETRLRYIMGKTHPKL